MICYNEHVKTLTNFSYNSELTLVYSKSGANLSKHLRKSSESVQFDKRSKERKFSTNVPLIYEYEFVKQETASTKVKKRVKAQSHKGLATTNMSKLLNFLIIIATTITTYSELTLDYSKSCILEQISQNILGKFPKSVQVDRK